MHHLPRAVQLHHHAAFVVRSDLHTFGQRRADEQGVTCNRRIVIALD